MAERRPFTIEDIIRIMVGSIMPLLRKQISDFVKHLPKEIKNEWVASLIGGLAQIVEKAKFPLDLQESASDLVEALAREIAAQSGDTPKEIKEKIDIKRIEEIFAKQLEEGLKKISEAENIEDEKAKQKKIMEAKAEYYKAGLILIREIITSVHQEIEVKEGKKINWEQVFNRLSEALHRSRTKIGEGTSTAYQKTKEAAKTADQKAAELAQKIEELRKKVRRHGLIPRRERE